MREPRGRLLEMSWDGFDANFKKELCHLWRGRDGGRTLSDMTIFCEGGSLKAHKIILAISSPYLLNMILETHSSCGQTVISLRGVDLEDLKVLVEFMYKGKAQIDDSRVEKISELAKSLCVRGFGEPAGTSSNCNGVERRTGLTRSTSMDSEFADSDGEEDEKNNENKTYIRPDEISLDDAQPNRVTRASLNAGKSDMSSPSKQHNRTRRLSESKSETQMKPLRTPLGVSSLAEKLLEKVVNDENASSTSSRPTSNQMTSSASSLATTSTLVDRNPPISAMAAKRQRMIEMPPAPTITSVDTSNVMVNGVSKLMNSTSSISNGTNVTTSKSKASAEHKCKSCDYTSSTLALLNVHIKKKHPHDVFASGDVVATGDGAPDTRKSMTPEGAHRSTVLNTSSSSSSSSIPSKEKTTIVQSLKSCSSNKMEGTKTEVASNGDRFSCGECGFVAGNAGALGSHRNIHKSSTSTPILPSNMKCLNISSSSTTATPSSSLATPSTNTKQSDGTTPTAPAKGKSVTPPKTKVKANTSLTRSRNKASETASSSSTSPSNNVNPQASVATTLTIFDLIAAECYKMIYDCPKCESVSFKTAGIMNRHLLKKHSNSREKIEALVRAKCSYCDKCFDIPSESSTTFASSFSSEISSSAAQHGSNPNSLNALVNHVATKHKIDTSKLGKVDEKFAFVPIVVKQEPLEEPMSALGGDGKIGDNSSGEATAGGGGGNDDDETASNADTERASSRGSFVMTASGAIKRNRLSHDDDATMIDAEVKVKKEPEGSGEGEEAGTGGELEQSSSKVITSAFHKCDLCNYQTSMEHFMKRHKIACHSNGKTEDPFVCKYCSFSTENRSTIKSHLVKAHKDSTTKVRDCFRNIEKIKKLDRSKCENGRILVKKITRKSFPGAEDPSISVKDAKSSVAEKRRSDVVKKRKRTTKVGADTPSTSSSKQGAQTSDSAKASTSAKSPSVDRTAKTITRKKSTTLVSKTKSKVNDKSNINAALKLKKAALAKQRRKTEPAASFKTSVAKSTTGSKTPILKRISSRLSSGAVSTPSVSSDTSATTSPEGGDRKSAVMSKYAVGKISDLKCPDCTYVARSIVMFDKHTQLHQNYDENKLALCELCGVVKLKGSMPYHMKKHEQESAQPTTQ